MRRPGQVGNRAHFGIAQRSAALALDDLAHHRAGRHANHNVVAAAPVAQRAGAVHAANAREMIGLEREIAAVLVSLQVNVAAAAAIAAVRPADAVNTSLKTRAPVAAVAGLDTNAHLVEELAILESKKRRRQAIAREIQCQRCRAAG